MWITRQKTRLQDLYREFPRPFWTLTGVTLIDQVGGALLYPFFALYFTSRFEVGMTQVGFLFALYAVSSFAGQLIGGALSDRIGRRTLLIFSLVTTSTSSLLMRIVESVTLFYALAIFVGVFVESGQPARQAIVADLLPEEKRAEGYAIIRVAFNLATAIGPAIGGFVASRSYLALFVADAVISLIAAFIVWRIMPETKPEPVEGEADESFASSFRGYGKVLRDSPRRPCGDVIWLFTGCPGPYPSRWVRCWRDWLWTTPIRAFCTGDPVCSGCSRRRPTWACTPRCVKSQRRISLKPATNSPRLPTSGPAALHEMGPLP